MGSRDKGTNKPRGTKQTRPMDKKWRDTTKQVERIHPERLRQEPSDSLMFHLWLRNEIMRFTKVSEIKVCLALAEQTYGWHRSYVLAPAKKLAKRTGLSVDGVRKALNALEGKGIITRRGEAGEVQEIGFAYDGHQPTTDTPTDTEDETDSHHNPPPDKDWWRGKYDLLEADALLEHDLWDWRAKQWDDEFLRTLFDEYDNAATESEQKAVLMRYGTYKDRRF